ncbi:MAG: NUDIX domain-containing protein [Candidatus Promineifilaceae bacterium]|nr:NUDIX domain-containing protein [Candidatus Promineifilaceae bacterium]
MPLIRKVVAYITFGQRLLVFIHPHNLEAGIQVPSGTIEEGESAYEAVMREAIEETDLVGLQFKSYLGSKIVNMGKYGKDETHDRAFFHLLCSQEPPKRWRHDEHFRSDSQSEPITFEFYWVELPGQVPELAAAQGALLEQVKIVR